MDDQINDQINGQMDDQMNGQMNDQMNGQMKGMSSKENETPKGNNNSTEKEKKKMLLHSCCGPCSTAVIERLADRYDLTVYFYNPNITDSDEYDRRLEAQHQVVEKFNDSHPKLRDIALTEGPYDPEYFFDAVKGFEQEPEDGARCDICFRVRMESTAKKAEEEGYDIFATTLSVSPHKNTNRINNVGYALKDEYDVEFLDESFKKKDGFKRSVELSREYGIYRQNYCGCVFSRRD